MTKTHIPAPAKAVLKLSLDKNGWKDEAKQGCGQLSSKNSDLLSQWKAEGGEGAV